MAIQKCFTIKEAKELWDYAKGKYLSVPTAHGYPDFRELTQKLSDDVYRTTGKRYVPEEIAHLLATPKVARSASKNLLFADANRRKMLSQARNFVTGNERSPLGKFIAGAYQTPYSMKVAFHNVALHGTHAWPYALDPKMWGAFGKTWWSSMKSMKESNARALSEHIMLDPNFDEQVSHGLAVDPRAVYDDIQRRTGFWGKIGAMLEHSFLGLKALRQMAYNSVMSGVPEYLRTDEMKTRVATMVNHMTGTTGPVAARALAGKAGDVVRSFAFAPSLDVARVMRPADLIQSVGTEIRRDVNRVPVVGRQAQRLWHEASPEQRWLARYNMQQWARIGAVGAAILYTNQQVLKKIFHSDEDVNISDVNKPDWAAVKGPDGHILQATGGEVPLARVLLRSFLRPKEAPNIVGNYILGKLHPFLGMGYTVAKGWGFGGEEVPAPFGKGEATPAKWAEFLASELGPISTEEGIHEFARQMANQSGVPEPFAFKLVKATAMAVMASVPAELGTHYYKPTYRPKGGGQGKHPTYFAPGTR